MKLKLHSQAQSRDWILHWSASNNGKNLRLVTFRLHVFSSCPGRSLCAGCLLNISQWWLILWAAARSWVEGFRFHRQILQLLSAAPESSLQSLFILLYLCLSASLFISPVVFSLSVCPRTLVSSSALFAALQLVDMAGRVLRCVSSACVCVGHQNCLSGAQHSRSGGWDPDAEGERLTEHRGQRGGDQTDGGLQEPLQVYED